MHHLGGKTYVQIVGFCCAGNFHSKIISPWFVSSLVWPQLKILVRQLNGGCITISAGWFSYPYALAQNLESAISSVLPTAVRDGNDHAQPAATRDYCISIILYK
jgi:hypothetical protein